MGWSFLLAIGYLRTNLKGIIIVYTVHSEMMNTLLMEVFISHLLIILKWEFHISLQLNIMSNGHMLIFSVKIHYHHYLYSISLIDLQLKPLLHLLHSDSAILP